MGSEREDTLPPVGRGFGARELGRTTLERPRETIGIDAMIFGSPTLSIPINTASAWLAGMKERRPGLGIWMLPVELPAALRRKDRPGEAGLMVVAVEGGSPADRAGLLVGDVLLGVADEPLGGFEPLSHALAPAGDVMRLRVAHGGVVFEVEVDLRARGPGRAA